MATKTKARPRSRATDPDTGERIPVDPGCESVFAIIFTDRRGRKKVGLLLVGEFAVKSFLDPYNSHCTANRQAVAAPVKWELAKGGGL